MAESGRSKVRRETSVRDRIQFYEEIITEGEESSCSGQDKKLKTLPRRVRTPRSATASEESSFGSEDRSSSGTMRKERSRDFNTSKRRFAVQEILTSERSYVTMLDLLIMVCL